jgi:succinylglutamate desuccinylase
MKTIDLFQSLCQNHPQFKSLGPAYTYEYHVSSKVKTIALSAIVHGNEIIGVDIFNSLIQKIQSGALSPKINIRFVLGNLDAYHAGKRFLETDMNRSFLAQDIVTHEEKRAAEICPLLDGSSLFMDIHQTIEPALTAFMVFSYNENSFRFARALNHDLPIVSYKNSGHQGKGVTFSAAAISKSIPAITVETGEKGHSETQQLLGEQLVLKAIELLEKNIDFTKNTIEFKNTYTWGETVKNPDFSLELVKRFTNFEMIEAGELLAKNEQQEVKSPYQGVVLFPKYGEQRLKSPELIRILKPVYSLSDLG